MKFYLILILLLFSGCRWITGDKLSFSSFATITPPDGTPIFQKGFKDGCSNILTTRTTGFYKSIYKYNYDPSLIDNPEYTFGFSRGSSTCFNFYVGGRHTLGGAADTVIYGQGTAITSSTMNSTINYSEGSWSANHFGIGEGVDGPLSLLQKGKSAGGIGASGGTGSSAFSGHPFWGNPTVNPILSW